jgi:hypothetical protein
MIAGKNSNQGDDDFEQITPDAKTLGDVQSVGYGKHRHRPHRHDPMKAIRDAARRAKDQERSNKKKDERKNKDNERKIKAVAAKAKKAAKKVAKKVKKVAKKGLSALKGLNPA